MLFIVSSVAFAAGCSSKNSTQPAGASENITQSTATSEFTYDNNTTDENVTDKNLTNFNVTGISTTFVPDNSTT